MKVKTVTASLLLIIFLLSFTPGNGQTFQYSRGWTNGKRSDLIPTYGEHSEAPWSTDDISASYRHLELSRLLARLTLPPFGYHVYAYDLTPSTTVTPAPITSHLYQRPQVKHAANDLSPANLNEISGRYKRKTMVQEVLP